MRRLSPLVVFLVAAGASTGLALAVDDLVPDAPPSNRPIRLQPRATATTTVARAVPPMTTTTPPTTTATTTPTVADH